MAFVGLASLRRSAASIPCVVATGLHAASLAKLPASLLLRPNAPPPGTLAALRSHEGIHGARRNSAHPKRRRTAPPPGVGGPDSVDPYRFSDADGSVGASVGCGAHPGFVASRVRARASAEGGVRRLAGRAGRPIKSLRPQWMPATERRATKAREQTERRARTPKQADRW